MQLANKNRFFRKRVKLSTDSKDVGSFPEQALVSGTKRRSYMVDTISLRNEHGELSFLLLRLHEVVK